MPIYEFKCLDCQELTEFLFTRSDEDVELVCGQCRSANLERVLSVAGHAMGLGPKGSGGVGTQSRNCSGGSCTTWTLPGHQR